ncbi:hypothetical protein EUTSA_v10027985mg [Eutrema salsugineum]|uniref:Uncharacterized protein n=1 Tax=Eutrema salsugineum TaxID=72664 RepID=V4LX55_EUTSA|nr:hypothetical protein EUTSA_v10027985mg [Eutrema salsugineum]
MKPSSNRNRSPPRVDPIFDHWENPRNSRHQPALRISKPSHPPPAIAHEVDLLDKVKRKAVVQGEDDDNSDAGDFDSSPKLLEIGSASDPITDTEDKSVFGMESVPTDWGDRVDGEKNDTELTEKDLSILDECDTIMDPEH